MYGCESWTVKAECRRIDAFELWCWGKLLRVPWTSKRSTQSILKEISPEYSLERLKAECRRIDAFELWCWRRLLRVPWTTRTGRDWGQEEKGTTEDEMAGWHH